MKAKVKNCINNTDGIFVCYANYKPIVMDLINRCYGKYVAISEEVEMYSLGNLKV